MQPSPRSSSFLHRLSLTSPPTTTPAIPIPKLMPLIACFHGGGSNAAVYKEQCSQLEHLLEPDFRFVYFEAPFEHPPGHGMLPAFADYAPFKSWFTRDETGT